MVDPHFPKELPFYGESFLSIQSEESPIGIDPASLIFDEDAYSVVGYEIFTDAENEPDWWLILDAAADIPPEELEEVGNILAARISDNLSSGAMLSPPHWSRTNRLHSIMNVADSGFEAYYLYHRDRVVSRIRIILFRLREKGFGNA